MTGGERGSFGYKPGLDGLRAVAVGAVIAFHFEPGKVGGGYLGVDIFFVLSGYLITSLLLLEWSETGRIDLRAFWARRARRLLPALFLVLLAVTVWSGLVLDGRDLGRIRGEGLATLFYSVNWYFVHGGQDYFDQFTLPSPLFHMFSLAIEEQYYLVWPLVVFACLGISRGKPRTLVWVLVISTVASVMLMAVLYVPHDTVRSYEGTDTRAHELLVGGLLAVALRSDKIRAHIDRIAPRVLAPVAAVLCAGVVLFTSRPEHTGARWLYMGGAALFGLGVAAVIAAAVAPVRSPIRTFLELPPLVWLGRISYGLYLWHVPVLVALTRSGGGLVGWQLTILGFACTLLFATLSFYLVEQPIRRGALTSRMTRFTTPIAIAGVATALIIVTTGAASPR